MVRKEVIFMSTAALVLCAGLAAGRLWGRLAEEHEDHEGHDHGLSHITTTRGSWLADQLDLTVDQRQKMDAIWSDAREKMEKLGQHRRELAEDRDRDILNMLNDQQKAEYQKIYADFHAQRDQLDKQRQLLVDDASQRSRLLLDDNQRKEWDVLSKHLHERRNSTNPSPSTQPATTQPAGGTAAINLTQHSI
jgi:Spy/CpxP family protein refolding chaperone